MIAADAPVQMDTVAKQLLLEISLVGPTWQVHPFLLFYS